RRLALATLLAQDPELYLLDEPLNHLDLGQKHLLLQYFHKQSRQKKISVLMVLHDINIAEQYCDRIVMLLGEGQTRVGLKKELLTEAQLSILYHHPLHLREDGEKRWWLAE
ncbi:MAG TPA: ABC transporter ATP-binding protein, partial [Gammaproteobacteria bacterium]|nr:ABC transporter ATP-binding protein [Gammaproteobacteria bacterium]